MEDATKKARRKTKVFRKLKRQDIASDLLGATVYIVWPDNGAWYGATVKQVWQLASIKAHMLLSQPSPGALPGLRIGEPPFDCCSWQCCS